MVVGGRRLEIAFKLHTKTLVALSKTIKTTNGSSPNPDNDNGGHNDKCYAFASKQIGLQNSLFNQLGKAPKRGPFC